MKFLRKLLLKIVGLKAYYIIISRAYTSLTASGFLKKKYPELFYLQRIIKPGFVCIDIGANMGYYTTFLSRLAGAEGKVYSVEPVPMFIDILRLNAKSTGVKNIEILPYAVGEKNTVVKMGTPVVDGLIHHGMTKVASLSDEKYAQEYSVEMKVPDELFANLARLDFIKCDIEGYEYYVFSNMMKVINRFKPVIQTELNNMEGRRKVVDLLAQSGYSVFGLSNNSLVALTSTLVDNHSSDFYFLHKQ
jgi:FkbM family methyltransferase